MTTPQMPPRARFGSEPFTIQEAFQRKDAAAWGVIDGRICEKPSRARTRVEGTNGEFECVGPSDSLTARRNDGVAGEPIWA